MALSETGVIMSEEKYSKPTKKSLEKAFGKDYGQIKVTPRKTNDVDLFIENLDKIYKESKKAVIKFD